MINVFDNEYVKEFVSDVGFVDDDDFDVAVDDVYAVDGIDISNNNYFFFFHMLLLRIKLLMFLMVLMFWML